MSCGRPLRLIDAAALRRLRCVLRKAAAFARPPFMPSKPIPAACQRRLHQLRGPRRTRAIASSPARPDHGQQQVEQRDAARPRRRASCITLEGPGRRSPPPSCTPREEGRQQGEARSPRPEGLEPQPPPGRQGEPPMTSTASDPGVNKAMLARPCALLGLVPVKATSTCSAAVRRAAGALPALVDAVEQIAAAVLPAARRRPAAGQGIGVACRSRPRTIIEDVRLGHGRDHGLEPMPGGCRVRRRGRRGGEHVQRAHLFTS